MYLESLIPLSQDGLALNVVPYSHLPSLQHLCPWHAGLTEQPHLWDKSWEIFDPFALGVKSFHLEFGTAILFTGTFTHGGGSAGVGHPRMHVYMTNSREHVM